MDFKVGDLVKLKSTSPTMVVCGIHPNGYVNTVWYDNGQSCIQSGSFISGVLDQVTPEMAEALVLAEEKKKFDWKSLLLELAGLLLKNLNK